MRDQGEPMRETTTVTVHASPVTTRAVARRWSETLFGLARAVGSGLAMAVFLSLIGAFESAEIPLGYRLFYWGLMMVCGTLVAAVVDAIACTWLRHRLHLEGRPWLYGVLLTALLTPSISLVVWAVTPLFGHMKWDISLYPRFLTSVGIICVAMTAINVLINREPQQSHAFTPAPAADSDPRHVVFLDRLPFKHQRADILALSAEDHYLRVHTTAGDTLILMRLYDAIRELEGIEGSQTHRSWWVARGAVEDVRRREGKVSLILPNTLEVPVSRSFQKILKADGWI